MLKHRRGIVIVVIGFMLLTSIPVMSAKKPASKQQLQTKLATVNSRIATYRAKIREARRQHKTISGQLQYTEQRLDVTQARLSKNKVQLADAQYKLSRISARLIRKERELARRSKLLSRRIVDIYEGEDLTYLNVLLGSTDIWTLLTRSYYIDRIVKSDADLVEQMKKDKEQIERDKKEQAAKVKQISTLQAQLIADRDYVQALADAKEEQLKEIENDAARYEQMMNEMVAESEALGAMIRRWQATPRGQVRYAKKYTGGLGLPVAGRISSQFGYRFHPILRRTKLHTGVDIAAPTGTPIHAAGDGEVILASYIKAYGNAVVIDHGGGVTTLYGHCSRLYVRRGEEVKKGQVVAAVGSTGWSTGSHCHFEKQVHGQPVNPR